MMTKKLDWVQVYTGMLCLVVATFMADTFSTYATGGHAVFYALGFAIFLPPWLRVWGVL